MEEEKQQGWVRPDELLPQLSLASLARDTHCGAARSNCRYLRIVSLKMELDSATKTDNSVRGKQRTGNKFELRECKLVTKEEMTAEGMGEGQTNGP